MAWKPEVQVMGEGEKWHRNGLVFATKEEAESNARDLMSRWMLVTNCRAAESDEPVNYRWENGNLVNLVPGANPDGYKGKLDNEI